MVYAYVMIRTTPVSDGIDQLKRDLLAVSGGIVNAHIVVGGVDFIVRVEVDSPADMESIVGGIQSVVGIRDTQTYITMDWVGASPRGDRPSLTDYHRLALQNPAPVAPFAF